VGQLAGGGLTEGDFFTSLATMVAALAVIILVLYGALFLYKRFLGGRLMKFTGGVAFKQVASFAVGPRQRIVILEINGEMMACGVTPSQITFLTRLDGAGVRRLAAGEAAEGAPAGTAGGNPLAPAQPAEPGKADPVHQFAELLKQKVRSLKRIN
jgi:flagellar protein FliO/FliZ